MTKTIDEVRRRKIIEDNFRKIFHIGLATYKELRKSYPGAPFGDVFLDPIALAAAATIAVVTRHCHENLEEQRQKVLDTFVKTLNNSLKTITLESVNGHDEYFGEENDGQKGKPDARS